MSRLIHDHGTEPQALIELELSSCGSLDRGAGAASLSSKRPLALSRIHGRRDLELRRCVRWTVHGGGITPVMHCAVALGWQFAVLAVSGRLTIEPAVVRIARNDELVLTAAPRGAY